MMKINSIISRNYSRLSSFYQSLNVHNQKSKLQLIAVPKALSKNGEEILEFDPYWLIFNCHSAKRKQPETGSRTIDVQTIPKDLSIQSVKLIDDSVHIKWNESSKQDDSVLPIDFLIKNYPLNKNNNSTNYKTLQKMEFFDYENFFDSKTGQKNQQEIFKWMRHIAEYGLNVVKNVPKTDGKVKQLAELIGPIQNTIYGEIFNVKVEKNPINIAYSDAAIGFHMDLIYYESPPGLQFLHCLKFDSSIVGGENLFLDSFEAAEQFRKDYPNEFYALTKIPATFQKVHLKSNWPVKMTIKRPHIVLNHKDKIMAVNWSPGNEGPLTDVSQSEMKLYFESYLKFANYLNKNPKIIEYRLQESDVVCYNNRRHLHARKKFVNSNGARHLQGCYINMDEFKSHTLTREYYLNNNLASGSPVDASELESIVYGNHDYS